MNVDGACEAYPAVGTDDAAFLAAADAFRPDAVIVAVPDHLHAEICIPLVERGLHCLVVKPMATTRAEAEAMARAADAAGVVAQVEFHKRLDESNLLLRDAIRAGRIGLPLYATVAYSQRKVIPEVVFSDWAARSNIFQYLGVHYVDLLQWATGFVPRRVRAWGQKDHLAAAGIDTWDAMQVVIEWRRDDGGDFVSCHVANWIDPDGTSAMSDQKISVIGTKGRVDADQKNRGVQMVTDEAGIEDINPYFSAAWHGDDDAGRTYHGYGIASVMQFLDDVRAVRAGTTTSHALAAVRPSFAQCALSTAVVEAALASLESGTGVEIGQ